ncbi:MAG: hypothetical protein P4L39_06535 [Humidesulfovibrio sp.]|nr:hypothetical protein [Humidesulfovibrio sp.]
MHDAEARQGTGAEAVAFTWRHAALVFGVALIPRLAHWWFVRHTPLASEFVPDLSAYLFAVDRLMHSAYFFVEPMLMSPGYALVLAPQYILVGPDVPVFVLVNAVLDAASAALCAGLAAGLAARLAPSGRERVLAVRTGLLAGLLYALCGPLLFYDLLPLGEGPTVFCLLAGLTLLFAAPRRGAPAAWLSGALFALAALIRPNLAPGVLLALAVWSLFPGAGRRARLAVATRCALGLLIALTPFMAHNAKVAGRVSPFGFQGGFTLYTGNHPGASGVGDALPGFGNTPYVVILQAWRQAEEHTGHELSLAGADAYWYGRTWRFFAGHPGEAARLMARKALLLLNAHGLDATANQDFCARFSPVPGWLDLPVGLVFALAAVGLWAACRRRAGQMGEDDAGRCPPEAAALLALLLGVSLLVVLFQVTPRYRVVLLPLAFPFAALALAELLSSIPPSMPLFRRGGWRAHAAPLSLSVLLLATSFIPLRLLVDKPGLAALEHARLARYYLLAGPQSLARVEFAEALRLSAPDQTEFRAGLKSGLAASLLLGNQDAPRP